MPDYKLLKDAYYGEGGFLTGEYLEKHGRETDDNYAKRKKLCYYYNYFGAIVNALVDPIFRKKPGRKWTSTGAAGTMIETFVANVDNNGTSLNAFMSDAAFKARLLGACYICMENFKELPVTVDKAVAQRKLPYIYIVEPEFVSDWAYDNYGNLVKFAFSEPIEKADRKIITRKVEFDAENVTIYLDGIQKSQVKHGLTHIPVIPFPARIGSRRTAKPASEMEPLAKCALAQFNYLSYLGEILRNQTFSILTLPGSKPSTIEIGTNNALTYSPDETNGAAPAFIAPPSEPANTLIAQIKSMTEEMYRIAGLSFITGTKQESSGVAKAWEFERTNQNLAAYAERCHDVEMAIIKLFCEYADIKSDYEVTYADDYGIVDVASEITTAQSVLDLNLGPDELKKQVLEKVLTAYLPDLSDEDYDEIMGAFDAQSQSNDYKTPPTEETPSDDTTAN